MRARPRKLTVIALALAVMSGCSGGSTSPSPGATASSNSVSSVTVAAPLGLFAGDSSVASALATAFLTSSTTSNTQIRDQATWQSSNTTVATVAPGGAVTAFAGGIATLTATYQGVSGSDTLFVLRDSDLLGLDVGLCSTQLLVGQTLDCTVTLVMQGIGTGFNVAAKAAWSSTNAGVVSVTPGGHVTAVSAGQATISATYRGKTGSLPMSVAAAQQDALEASGAGQSGQFRVGNTVSMSLEGLYSVVSAATGQLSLRIADQNGTVVTTTAPTTVQRGSNSFFLSASFTVPQGATRVCAAAILQVGSTTVTSNGLFGNAQCANVVP